jgi:CheY-like chemotaxis protein
VEISQPLIDADGHELTISLPAEPLWIDGDLVRLAQVVSNLLNNAARYSERNRTIALVAEREGNKAILRVRDQGLGISTETMPHIWDLFVQGHRDADSAQGGMGIGLTLVRSFTELHGGTVDVRSEGLSRGSEFIVTLPLAEAPGLDNSTSGTDTGAEVAPRRILAVDDNVDAAESLALLLRMGGHDTRVAHDAASALKLAESDPPDIAFLDIGMPVIDGYELAKRFREHPTLKEVKLVALTGWGQEEDRRRTKQAGFDAHEVKPVTLETLNRILEEC